MPRTLAKVPSVYARHPGPLCCSVGRFTMASGHVFSAPFCFRAFPYASWSHTVQTTPEPGLHFRGLGLVRALGVLRLGRRSRLWHLPSCAVVWVFHAYNLVEAIVGRRACVVGAWRGSSLHLALQPA